MVEYSDPDGFGNHQYLRTIEFAVHIPFVVYDPHVNIGDFSWGKRVLWGLGYWDDNAFWLEYNGTNEWEVRRATTVALNYNVASYQEYRYPVDDKAPIFATGRIGPGEPIVFYHTNSGGAPRGIVIGYQNLAGCLNEVP